MTHVANVESLTRLVGFCSGYGGYNPGRQNLQLNALVNQLTKVQQVINQVKVAKAQFDNETNGRRQGFKEVELLAARVLRTLKASGAHRETIADAQGFFSQLVGQDRKDRAPVSSDQTTEVIKVRRSSRQLAFASKAASFAKLVETVLLEPLYQPNESALSKGELVHQVTYLNDLNNRVINARIAWSNALWQRDLLLYKEAESVHSTIGAVKDYIMAAYGKNSQQFQQVKNIRFTKPIK